VLVAVVTSACAAKRTLTITSEPEGAQVRLDDERVGWTPITTEFHHYGTRRLTLAKDGYRVVSRQVELVPPWYARFPLDVVSEVLLPFGWRDRHELHFELEPGGDLLTTPDLRSVLDRAEFLRRAGPEGPRPLPPTRLLSVGSASRSEDGEGAGGGPDDGGAGPPRRAP